MGLASDEFPYTAFYAKKSLIEKDKNLLTNFTKAINKGLNYTYENDGNNVANVIKNQFSDTDINDLATMIERYKKADVWLKDSYISKDFFNTLVNLLKENDLIKNDVSYKDLVNNLNE